jgi:tellurite resistance protein
MAWEPYTEQQWRDLTDAVPAIARAVASVSGSAAQSEVELNAFLKLLQETAASHGGDGDGTLLTRLVSDVQGRLAGGVSMPETDAMTDGLQAARRAGALLEIYPDAGQAREVRLWLLDVARRVAQSARDGGVLGIGGQQISNAESDTLLSIADALGLSAVSEG